MLTIIFLKLNTYCPKSPIKLKSKPIKRRKESTAFKTALKEKIKKAPTSMLFRFLRRPLRALRSLIINIKRYKDGGREDNATKTFINLRMFMSIPISSVYYYLMAS